MSGSWPPPGSYGSWGRDGDETQDEGGPSRQPLALYELQTPLPLCGLHSGQRRLHAPLDARLQRRPARSPCPLT